MDIILTIICAVLVYALGMIVGHFVTLALIAAKQPERRETDHVIDTINGGPR